MLFKLTLWACALLFVATVYNVVGAYDALGGVDVQGKFEEVGLLEGTAQGQFPLPVHKPLMTQQLAAN